MFIPSMPVCVMHILGLHFWIFFTLLAITGVEQCTSMQAVHDLLGIPHVALDVTATCGLAQE